MPESVDITEQKARAIGLLAAGESKTSVAVSLGVSSKTIQRWGKDQSFSELLAAEIERRKARLVDGIEKVSNEAIDEAVSSLQAQLAEYHEAVVNVQKIRLSRGKALMDRAYKRFKDLPEESISPKDIPALMALGDRMIQAGLETWGDALALGEVLERFSDEG